MAGARHFTELDCWQLSTEFKLRIYDLVRRRRIAADWQFREQISDAAASAPRNISEGFARRTHKEFAHYLDIARASLHECQNHLLDGMHRRHIEQDEYQELLTLNRRACGAVAALQRYLRGGGN